MSGRLTPSLPASDNTGFLRQLSFGSFQRMKDGPRQVRAVADVTPMDFWITCWNLIVRELPCFSRVAYVTLTIFTAAGASTHDCQHHRARRPAY